ncbi:MAG: amidohydrolase family protein [Gemmatimonadaceae bacterium]
MRFSFPRLPGLAALLTLALPLPLAAQDTAKVDSIKRAAGKDLPLKTTRSVRFTTDEGTWLSLDVSPDGKTIVFDMMGDLYTLPIEGGKATRITDGPAFDGQPRFSPDGKRILFVSDRSGYENLWLIDPDGKNPRALTKETKSQFVSPTWAPDGRYIVTSRNLTGVLGSTYDLYLYHKDGGNGLKLTQLSPPVPGVQPPPSNYMGAAFGKDSRYVYVATRRGGFGYNLQFPGWQIAVLDRETGKVFSRTDEGGSAMRPVLSRDGKYMVYATRHDTATVLKLREMASGDETWLGGSAQRDDQESRFTRDLMPGMAFTPDGKSLVSSHDGKIWKVDIPTGKETQIPFSADVALDLGPLVHFDYAINDTTLTIQQIRGARPSPDGKHLVFTALDRLWLMNLPSGKPHRITNMTLGEHSPVWSPDGRYIAYVTWSDSGGNVYRVSGDGKGAPQRLTRDNAFYSGLNYTPTGSRLVVARGPRQSHVEHDEPAIDPASGLELVWLPAGGGATTSITPLTFDGWPHFTRDTSRIYIYDANDGLISFRFDGTDRRSHVKVTGYMPPGGGPNTRPQPAEEILVSPDGDRAIAQVNNNVYLVDVPVVGGQTPTISVLQPAGAPVPVRRITRVGGDFLGWNPDGKGFYYSLGHSWFSYDIPRADSLVRDSTLKADSVKKAKEEGRDVGARGDSAKTQVAKADTVRAGKPAAPNVALTPKDSLKVAQADSAKKPRYAYEPARLDVLISVPRDRAMGSIALRNARIISMKGDEVIERGDILVKNNRIAAVGAAGSVTIPSDAKVIDMAGKTILPGWVDVHAHMWPQWGIHRSEIWQYLAQLAYGVTSTRDPQTATTDVLSYSDMVDAGEILGPRIFSTGPGVFWSEDIASLDDARDVLRRYSEYYNTHTIKQYMAGDRRVRQWVIMAARELGLMPTSEGGLDFKKNMTEAMDGYPGAEHSYPITPLFKDVVQTIAQAGITNTPTLLVNYGGPWTENYWYEHYDIHKDAKLMRFTPHEEIDQRALRRPSWFRDDQYVAQRLSAQSAKIAAAGGKIGLGGHGQLQGLGTQWELWNIASGGMPAHDVLRVGTINGAESIGLGKEIGSLEPGKLADLQVLDGNPLADIKNTNTVHWVMKNGRLYEAESLKEIWPRQREISKPWWWMKEPFASAEQH